MKFQKIWAGVLLSGLLVGCGGTSTPSATEDHLPEGNVLIFFDNNTSEQYKYDTDSGSIENMNQDGAKYDMRGKHGTLIVWNHHTDVGVDPKIVMLDDNFTIQNGDLTHEDFHYLGHFHEDNETNETIFAPHSASEFDPNDENITDKKLATLDALNVHLHEQEEIREEISEALQLTTDGNETLCNFFVFEHEHEEAEMEEPEEEEAAPHIALTASGKVYIFKEGETGLVEAQVSFSLNGVTECQENESSIIPNGEGMFIFSAQTQKLYLVDSHDGSDFHVHSSFGIDSFLPAGFTPTDVAGIGEGHDHDHEEE